MTARLAILLLISTAACAPNERIEPCGMPSKIWVGSDDFVYPHHAAIHKIEVTHINQVIVNNVPRDENEVEKFLADLGSNPWDILLFDFDAHSDCTQVRSVRKIIESSKFCSQKNCIYGDATMELPEYKPTERGPS
jgi:hypothetical protein